MTKVYKTRAEAEAAGVSVDEVNRIAQALIDGANMTCAGDWTLGLNALMKAAAIVVSGSPNMDIKAKAMETFGRMIDACREANRKAAN